MVIVALTALTAMCAAGAPMVVRAWRGEPGLAEVPRYGLFAKVKKKDRVRAGPAAFVSACLMCVASWMAVLLGPADKMSVPAGLLFLAVVALWVGSFVAIVTVVLFNRPTFLVAPALRRQWGSVKVRRTQRRRDLAALRQPPD